MDVESPPRKKMKQARLPFQILSHKGSSPDTKPSASSRKRQLSEDSQDDVILIKVGKKSEEFKENETAVPSSKDEDGKESEVPNGNKPSGQEENLESSPVTEEKSELKVESLKPQEASVLQTQMKSNLANLFEKKAFDPTADVGTCDCGCEEADSDNEALEEYLEHCKKRKLSPNSTAKEPKQKSRRKSGTKIRSKPSSPAKQSDSSKNSSPAKQRGSSKNSSPVKQPDSSKKSSPAKQRGSPKVSSPTKQPNSSKISSPLIQTSPRQRKKSANSTVDASNSSQENVVGEKADRVEPQSTPESASKQKPAPKTGILSKKAYDMFAKWRKSPTGSSHKDDGSKKRIEQKHENNSSNEAEVNEKSDDPLEISNSIETAGVSSNSEKELMKESVDSCTDALVDKEKNIEEDAKDKGDWHNDVIELSDSEPLTPQKNKGSGSKTLKVTSKMSDEDLQGNSGSPVASDLDKPSLTLTPTLNVTPQRRLTPKQIERQKEIARKQEEKEKQRVERENEKKRLKQEKDEQKRKEKEEKEEQRRKEKEEKEKKRQSEQELKIEEKKKKDNLKAEEKRKKDEDKRKAEEDEERKKAKASALFTSFFVPKATKTEREATSPPTTTVQNFMPFEVKADMRMAPQVRLKLSNSQKLRLEEMMKENSHPKEILYLYSLRSGDVVPKTAVRTWPLGESKEDDDICVLEADDTEVLISDKKKVEKMRAKFLLFHENHRPAYRGTWRKRSKVVTGRHPFGQEKILDYEVDSADEWEEEEPGESLNGSDDEKDKESEDEYELDNSVFVPHGYLSDDEGDGDENEEILSPETQKAKLKLLGEEFEAQMKSKTKALKPIIIVLTAALQASSCSVRYQKLLERRAVWQEDEGPISLTQFGTDNDLGDGIGMNSESNCVTFSSGPGAKKKLISEEAIPALITLVHGNQNKRVFLTNEFSTFLGKSQADETSTVPLGVPESSEQPSRPSTPCAGPNPLVLKWPGLPPASRISISNKIKEIATWGPCPEDGPMSGRQCWYVAEEIRVKYGLTDLKIPNNLWYYSLKPKVMNHSQSPVALANSGSISSADPRALITKFTKVMTPEEKRRQWDSMKSPAPNTPTSAKPLFSKASASTGKITAFTQQVKTPSSADSKLTGNSVTTTPTSNQPQAKKRVALLVSVPRGQQIASSSHCSLLHKFDAAASPQAAKCLPEVSASTSPKATGSNSNTEDNNCIVLD